MAWMVGAGLSLAGGLLSSKKASKEAKKSRKLQREQLDFAKSQYQDYKDMYGGIEADMIAEIDDFTPRDNLQKYLGETTADVAMSFDKQQEQEARRLGRYGIDPSQQRSQTAVSEIGRDKALAEVAGRTGARRQAEAETIADEDKRFARKLAAVSTGKQVPGQAGAVMGALQSGAAMHGAQAEQYGRGAQGAYGAAGQWLARGANQFAQPSTPSAPAGGAMPGPNAPYGPGGYGTYAPPGAGYGDDQVDY